jgi:hypothetical protein
MSDNKMTPGPCERLMMSVSCGCEVWNQYMDASFQLWKSRELRHCPRHAAVPELIEALQSIVEADVSDAVNMTARAALRKAGALEGKGRS